MHRLYRKWLVGKTGDPNEAPSAFIGYVEWLEQRVEKMERRLADCERQKEDLRKDRDRLKQLRRQLLGSF